MFKELFEAKQAKYQVGDIAKLPARYKDETKKTFEIIQVSHSDNNSQKGWFYTLSPIKGPKGDAANIPEEDVIFVKSA